jgi:hypothetical protein
MQAPSYLCEPDIAGYTHYIYVPLSYYSTIGIQSGLRVTSHVDEQNIQYVVDSVF